MSGWAKPGVKCVCIVGAHGCWLGLDNKGPTVRPIQDGVYTITEIDRIAGRTYLTFAECDGSDCFHIEAFRPLVMSTLDQDVALFIHHLDCVGEPA